MADRNRVEDEAHDDRFEVIRRRTLFSRQDFEAFGLSRRSAMRRVAYLAWAVVLSLGLLAAAAARNWAGMKLGIASMVFVLAGRLPLGLDVLTR
jgi:hypothetical protein